MKALFAPDYGQYIPYQRLLAEALLEHGISVEYLRISSRALPLTRSLSRQPADLLHLHWPEDLFLKGDRRDLLRRLRFVADFLLAQRKKPIVHTVHDLYPLRDSEHWMTRWVIRTVVRNVSRLIVHSQGARDVVCETFGVPPESCEIIPVGDLSIAYGELHEREFARAKLGLKNERVCLCFGAVLANKGLDTLARWWAINKPDALLAIVGKDYDAALAEQLRATAANAANILLRFGFQSDEELNLWFSAAAGAIINYRSIFASGVACLARSWGVPLMLPHRLTTIDLDEPHPLVFRYEALESDFSRVLQEALASQRDGNAAKPWRSRTAWKNVAAQTAQVYERVCGI